MSKAGRERTARERLAAERARAAAAGRRRRAGLIGLVALAVIAVAVVAVVVIRGAGEDDAYQGALAPVSRQPDGSVAMAAAGVTKPVLEIYEDFQCPACRSFEEATRDTLKELAAAGKVRVVYRPFSLFRDFPEPTSGNSKRALNASLCAPADKWMAYHDKLFDEQGPESAKGFGNDQLISWAGDVGITGDAFATCVNSTAKAAEMDKVNQAATKAGVESTPHVTLNGQPLGNDTAFTPDRLRRAIEATGS